MTTSLAACWSTSPSGSAQESRPANDWRATRPSWKRVAGPNPMLIANVRELPAHFPLTNPDYQHSMGTQDSLSEALAEGRLFLLDYQELSCLEPSTWEGLDRRVYAPIAAFAVPKDGRRLTPSPGARSLRNGHLPAAGHSAPAQRAAPSPLRRDPVYQKPGRRWPDRSRRTHRRDLRRHHHVPETMRWSFGPPSKAGSTSMSTTTTPTSRR